ncbi:MAG TPA: tRNA uridine-5-carboxymethylaminomethyl(34) synthesis GTPase MnmE [Verrucomicrobiales bacterium]|nr:tRNA uridine-5-carboxymethylaminomethyl(34) synthesis GTPase MnmE [Verrucomicrobiales bacterium]
MLTDTIAAIATPLGEGGLAVIRVSGPEACRLADRCFRRAGGDATPMAALPSHTVHYGMIHREGISIDEVLLTVMRAPRTFTREDVIEVSCHGGLLPAKLVLEAFLAAGARHAEPGEFTRRAFLNGRIDLAQAEAVADLIHARTELALAAAREQLGGSLSREIGRLRDDLMRTLAHVEAHIDFPDEDIAPDTRDQLLARLRAGLATLDRLLQTAAEGQILRRGIRAAIIGSPNAGKSSLLNRLLGHDRAIVSPVAGTTRDTIEETANIRGIPVIFIDTAGLREAGDALEAEGVRRSRETLARAELILHVVDGSIAGSEADQGQSASLAGRACILVRNKSDLPQHPGRHSPADLPTVEVSCATGEGIEALKDRIRERVWSGRVEAGMFQVAINARHQEALRRAREATARAADSLAQGLTLEIVAMELHIAAGAVGEVVGGTGREDLLDAIFSQFCIGK